MVTHKNAFLVPCGHAFFYVCVHRSLSLRMRCPMCRATPIQLNGDMKAPPLHESYACKIGKETPFGGITVADSSAGVRIVSLNKKDAAFSAGLRPNDILNNVNGLPCKTHSEVVKIWDAATAHARECQQDVVLNCNIVRRRNGNIFATYLNMIL